MEDLEPLPSPGSRMEAETEEKANTAQPDQTKGKCWERGWEIDDRIGVAG